MKESKSGPSGPGKLKFACVLFAALLFVGCGTLQTVPPGSQERLRSAKRYERTDCDSVPRIYSGLTLDVCMALLGPPAPIYGKASEGLFYFYMFDGFFSMLLDTVALPYTVYGQIRYGDLYLKRRHGRIDRGRPPAPLEPAGPPLYPEER